MIKIKDAIDAIYEVIKKYQVERGMTFVEAIGILRLVADELSDRCRKGWRNEGEEWKK